MGNRTLCTNKNYSRTATKELPAVPANGSVVGGWVEGVVVVGAAGNAEG